MNLRVLWEILKSVPVMELCIGSLMICGTMACCMWIVKSVEGTEWKIGHWSRKVLLFLGSVIAEMVILCIPSLDHVGRLLLEIVAGCLLFACLTDMMICEVYQFTWWGAGGASVFLGIYENVCVDGIYGENVCPDKLFSETVMSFAIMVCYLVLQEMFFSRFYGRADCHAFVVCATAGCALGMGMPWFFLHMTTAFFLLIIVQIFQKNIGSRGRLRQAVAFLPYITLSFWLMIVFYIISK